MTLAISLLLAGVILHPTFPAWLLAAWAAAIAVVSALVRNIRHWWSKRHQSESEPPSPEESGAEVGSISGPAPKASHNGTREWGFSFKVFRNTRDED
jgi:hypothetical protein